MREKSQVSPDGARREAGLLELDIEGHVMLGQDGCRLGCPLLIATLDGSGQAPCQFCYKEREPSQPGTAASPNPPGHLPLPFSIKSPGLQGTSTLG